MCVLYIAENNKCKLECEHGDFEDENCICNCFEHWTGDKCGTSFEVITLQLVGFVIMM